MYPDGERVVAGGLVTFISSWFEVAQASENLLSVALIGRQYRGLAKRVKRKCAQKKRQERQGNQLFFVGFCAFLWSEYGSLITRMNVFGKPSTRCAALAAGGLLAACLGPVSVAAPMATRGMVASVQPLATQAGLNVLSQGGNAVDAAVAVALTLGVVDTENSGLGGGCFMLIRRANGSMVAIDGREVAPGAATRELFVRAGRAETELSQTGALASGVPGALAAYEFAVDHYGRKKLKDLILPAAEIAEQGFRLDGTYAGSLRSVVQDLRRFESSRGVVFRPVG